MTGIPWTLEEDAILDKPLSAAAVQAELQRAGYPHRSISTIHNRRDTSPEATGKRNLARTLLALAWRTLYGPSYRTVRPSEALRTALRQRLAKRTGKTTIRITLGGIAWLHAELGPDWEQHMEVYAAWEGSRA